jgi:hypothetical protein
MNPNIKYANNISNNKPHTFYSIIKLIGKFYNKIY